MSKSKEQRFRDAARAGDLSLLKTLAAGTALNINWQGAIGLTAFNSACWNGHLSVVQFFLTLTNIDVNKPTNDGFTPFFIACQNGHKEVVSLLLADMRIDVNQPNNNQCTPLWSASRNGHLPVVQLILASGREVDTKAKSIAGKATSSNKTAAEIGRYQGSRGSSEKESQEEYIRRRQYGPLIATLIDSYEQNPQQVRTQLRKELGLAETWLESQLGMSLSICSKCFPGET